MTSVQFLASHIRSQLGSTAFEPNQEEKSEEVLSNPKFGMFSLLAYHWTRGYLHSQLAWNASFRPGQSEAETPPNSSDQFKSPVSP